MLRRIDRLSAGMQVRLRLKEHKRDVIRQVRSVERSVADSQRLSVYFEKAKDDTYEYALGFNLYPDDLIEIAL